MPPPQPASTNPLVTQSSPDAPRLSARAITKKFGPVTVLREVSVDFRAGEIHAVVGENGAGKSTLMKIVAGLLEPTSGQVLFSGQPVALGSLYEMERLGVRLIHQELNLADDLTVVENLFLGEEERSGLLLNERKMRRQGREALERVGLAIDLNRRVADLRVSEKQMVEIAKAINREASVLILDEPTSVLTQRESDRLFALIEAAAARGVAVIYISHRLEEVKRLAHRVTVLRDGQLVATREANELAPDDIVRLMVGRSLHDLFPPKVPSPNAEPVLEVRHLSIPGLVANASFEVRQGEILGFAGLIGAGRTELFEGVVGLRRVSSGNVRRSGQPISYHDYPQAMDRLRVAYLPEDRKGKGLLVSFGARPNYSLLKLNRFGRWFVNENAERIAFERARKQFQIKVADPTMPVSRLSGGNQQKVVLAKVLGIRPEIVIFDEPTRGIDVGTKADVYRWIAEMAANGSACVLISSELLEIIGLCHRVIVMREGALVASLSGTDINENEIMLYATGVKSSSFSE